MPQPYESMSFEELRDLITVANAAQKRELEYHRPLGSLQGVVAYSNKADTFFSGERNYIDGIMSGFRYQCVEYARRYLLETRGVIFTDCLRASEIFDKDELHHVESGAAFPLTRHRNGETTTKPAVGNILIYPFVPEVVPWGHVAIVSAVGPDWVGVAEQNIDNYSWQERPFGRVIKLEHRPDGTWHLREHESDIVDSRGWMSFDIPEDRKSPRTPLPRFLPAPLQPHLTRRRIKAIGAELAAERSNWALPQLHVNDNDPSEAGLMALYRELNLDPVLDEFLNVYYPNEDLAITLRGYSNKAFRATWAALGQILQRPNSAERYGIPPMLMNVLRQNYEQSDGGRGCPLSSMTMAVVDDTSVVVTGVALDSLAHFTEADAWQHRVSSLNGHTRGFAFGVEHPLKLFSEVYFPAPTVVTFVDCGESGDDIYRSERLHAQHLYFVLSSIVKCQWVLVEDIEVTDEGMCYHGEPVSVVHTTTSWRWLFCAAGIRPAVHAVFVKALAAGLATFLPLPCLAPTSSPAFYTDAYHELSEMGKTNPEARAALRLWLTPEAVQARGGVVVDVHGCFVRDGAVSFFDSLVDGRPYETQTRVFLVDNFSAATLVLERLRGDEFWTPAAGRFTIRDPPPDDDGQHPETR